jgi:hypothetical protein
MRFYVPEWDDHVDADYDFIHDEHSYLDKQRRDMAYIWDIFDKSATPIDGVLISREQVEDTPAKFDRLTSDGVYEDSELKVPEWMPTISDCGAWGYKSLPFPPYENEGMLQFYETLEVSVGVTIDHLVLGSGHSARLYLDENAFPEGFDVNDIPCGVAEEVDDIMVDDWPDTWPEYVSEYEPQICIKDHVGEFDPEFFEKDSSQVIENLKQDPRAVYRKDDMEFRYELTLRNAEEMWRLYDDGDYSFRLMSAIQGWNPSSYVKAAEQVLDIGYNYIGIGGVAGSHENDVKDIVSSVGNTVRNHEVVNNTRVDLHVFGFAKTGAFPDIGRNGVASFDSASMLRSAWTGGNNYRLSSDRKYDALRVRYPKHTATLPKSIETALRGQEVLHAVRAFDENRAIAEGLENWHTEADIALSQLAGYLQENRWSDRYDVRRLRDVKSEFREGYEHSRKLKANFGEKFQSKLSKLLRRDNEDRPVDWSEYLELISMAREAFDSMPTHLEAVREMEEDKGEVGTVDHLWPLIESYTEYVEDEDLREEYSELLEDKPWEECECEICEEYGVEVAIFRGNNRNRRRGFHNTRRFYDEFKEILPKILVVTVADNSIAEYSTVEDYLREQKTEFWSEVHNIPVAEVGIVTTDGINEWWEETPDKAKTEDVAKAISGYTDRYQEIFVAEDEITTEKTELEDVDEGINIRTASEIPPEIKDMLDFSMQSLITGY